ncbi:hypothetical protein [Agaribacter flavus]|uniref:Uncharacterized protein n=1 Tax=Agaribacter flavus TaxID=1902781 RepID=A0ABV7FQQ8_9ALTE
MKQVYFSFAFICYVFFAVNHVYAQRAIKSFDVGHTITKVRHTLHDGEDRIIASTYEGAILALNTRGEIIWKNALSGFMNHDIWVQDIDNDGKSEIYIANADGSIFALNSAGKTQWTFKPNDVPMNAVTVIRGQEQAYIAAGGYDLSFYWLNADGNLLTEVPSSSYSTLRPWGQGRKPDNNRHTVNFLRPFPQSDGTDRLLLHGVIHTLAGSGALYEFLPNATTPIRSKSLSNKVVGDLRVVSLVGEYKAMMGSSSLIDNAGFNVFDLNSQSENIFKISEIRSGIDRFGYRVSQTEMVDIDGTPHFFTLYGSRVLITPQSLDPSKVEVISSRYSYNDMWKFAGQNKFVLASAQSGGSAIHVLDIEDPAWKDEYHALVPPGNISQILANSSMTRQQLMTFSKPDWEQQAQAVWLMSENTSSLSGVARDVYVDIEENYDSPIFLKSFWTSRAEDWDRSGMQNKAYRDRRDGRRKYDLSQKEFLDDIVAPNYTFPNGVSFWAGHGNDPYMFSPDTIQKVMDRANGKKSILIYPELEAYDEDAEWMVNDLIYPHAVYGRSRNTKFFLRNKHTFWQSIVYQPAWSRLMSGEFRDVFIPAMEETTDKSMELSVAARTGIWVSGVVDEWGARVARDSTSFDRTRQFSHQMLPNGYLRQMIYAASLGARSFDNFPIDQNYMSLFWSMLAKGLIYLPRREELISLSPVHLSMAPPDQRYLEEGNDVKWTSYYNAQEERDNPMVFSRLNGSWPGSPTTTWDFSTYAAGVSERRLNFLPPYPNGLVLITPPQTGAFAQKSTFRLELTDLMHPMYQKGLKEYYTDGRHYYSADGTQTFAATTYANTIKDEIENAASLLPINVSGNVAWVAAQSGPQNIRLTLIDSGFINPSDKQAIVHFNTISPAEVSDLLSKETYSVNQAMPLTIDIKAGMFRFLDITFSGEIPVIDFGNAQPTPPEPTTAPTPPEPPSTQATPQAEGNASGGSMFLPWFMMLFLISTRRARVKKHRHRPTFVD